MPPRVTRDNEMNDTLACKKKRTKPLTYFERKMQRNFISTVIQPKPGGTYIETSRVRVRENLVSGFLRDMSFLGDVKKLLIE